MTTPSETTGDALQSVWQVDHDHTGLDEDCSPTKSCRNMKEVTFDGYAEPGSDLGSAWRAKLEREGKLTEGSVRELIFGRTD